MVKTSDITSSKRSAEHNARVGGVPNNHLYGNAVDIHGTSKVWLKENGERYGWKNLVYSGHDGHLTSPKVLLLSAKVEKILQTPRTKTAVVTKSILEGMKDSLGGVQFENLRSLGPIGGFMEGVAEGIANSPLIQSVFGAIGSSVASAGSGLLSGMMGMDFGGDNKEVGGPDWVSGGFQIDPDSLKVWLKPR